MFQPIDAAGHAERLVTLHVDGRALLAAAGEMLALALLRAGAMPMRHSTVSGEPRAPLCLMGVCFDCLAQVDGRPNVQTCMAQVCDGMRVRLQHGARAVEPAA